MSITRSGASSDPTGPTESAYQLRRWRRQAGKDAVASSSLGLINLLVGIAACQPNRAIGLGMYSAALSIYPRCFGKGAKVAFSKDTRIAIQTTATQTPSFKSASAAP